MSGKINHYQAIAEMLEYLKPYTEKPLENK